MFYIIRPAKYNSMKKSVVFSLVFLLSVAYALAIEPTKLAEANMHFESSGTFEKIVQSPQYTLSSITVNLSVYPSNNIWQSVKNLKTIPTANIVDEFAIFEWKEPQGNVFSFRLSADVATKTGTMFINKKVPFPIVDLPLGYEIYTLPSETIDSDDLEITWLANNLAQGEDDLFVVLFKLGDWIIKNIDYNLSSLTVEANQKASWVMEKRYGVCDEITTLFIAMCRTLGIPARFVTGVAYTNYLDQNDWGNHAWAEVFFPGIGWVPYDITYKQIGYIDASHITLQESVDAEYIYTKYSWLGRNVDIKTHGLEMDTHLLSEGTPMRPKEVMDVRFLKDRVDFNSFNALVIELQNPSNVYVTVDLLIAKSTGYEFLNDTNTNVLLKPRETKTLYFPLEITEKLKPRYEYTFFGAVNTPFNNSHEASFKVLENDPFYTLEEIMALINQKTQEEKKNYSSSLLIDCGIQNPSVQAGTNLNVSCNVSNTGNTVLTNLSVCLDDCIKLNVSIGRSKFIVLQANTDQVGERELLVTANNILASNSDIIKVNVLDTPQIDFVNLTYPAVVSFDDHYRIIFLVNKTSYSSPLDLRIFLENRPVFDPTEELTSAKRFTINTKASNLPETNSTLELKVVYVDEFGNEYSLREHLNIIIDNITLWQRFILMYNKSPVQASFLAVALTVFFLVISYIFFKGASMLIFGKREKQLLKQVDKYDKRLEPPDPEEEVKIGPETIKDLKEDKKED